MIIGLKDTARYLYHYTKANTALEKILPNRSLMLTEELSLGDYSLRK
jgi:hypothetical protein